MFNLDFQCNQPYDILGKAKKLINNAKFTKKHLENKMLF